MEHSLTLYYIDSIHRPSASLEGERVRGDNQMAQVSLLNVNDSEGRSGRIITVPYIQLTLSNGKKISDNNFVYYNAESAEPFENGNKDPRAKELILRSAQLRKTIRDYSQDRQLELFNANNLQNATVTSYHVNVGHGNCSILFIKRGNSHIIWMVDCGTTYYVKGTHLENIDDCFSLIANTHNITKEKLHIDLFMLTHLHNDHYNGISLLFSHGYCNAKTRFYINLDYAVASPTYVSVLELINNNNCIVKTPIRNVTNQHNLSVPTIIYPDKRVFKNHSSSYTTPCYVESHTNNASAIYLISANNKVMMFPGDMEQEELNKMTKSNHCTPFLFYTNYYCVSHHASITGHLNCNCLDSLHPQTTCIDCCRRGLDKAIIMGKDKAYNGLYSDIVIADFGTKIVYSEKDATGKQAKCLILDWGSSNCTYLY